MDRSGLRAAAGVALVLLAAAVIAVVRLAPPVDIRGADLGWTRLGASAALAVIALLAALPSLVDGLRRGALASLLRAGASAAIAGAALGLIAGASAAVALLGSAVLLAAAALVGDACVAPGRTARVVAVATMVGAEAAAVAGLLPDAATIATPLLALGAMTAIGAGVASSGQPNVALAAGLLAVAASAFAVDRGGSLEMLLGLAALLAAQLLTIGATDNAAADEPREAPLPDLASRLLEPVLRFDGRLRLLDWNHAAAELIGLDGASRGSRIEDLLGVAIAELPADDGVVISRGAVGGLEVALHRSGDGLTAIVRDPGAATETERLGNELRTTIEELLRARRTIELQRGELERSATVDPLTGVGSRGAILERLRVEVAQARRYQHALAVVHLDIDRFGEINAAHGIGGGDAVLREVALRLRLRVREADALGRSGSDGFIALLPHTDAAGAAIFADALRHRLSQRPVLVGEVEVRVTVSIGVGTMRPGEDLDLDGLLARLQEALDSARSAGGDRIALDRQHGLARLEDPHDAEPASGSNAV